MKVGVIGATGKAGQLIVKETKDRGHEVTAFVRNASKVTDKEIAILEKNAFELTGSDIQSFDVVVNAFGTGLDDAHKHVELGRSLIAAFKDAPNTRLIVVGGAGSLFVDEAKTVQLKDTAEFPKEILPIPINQGKNLEDLQNSAGVKWTFVSPAAFFDAEGKKTGSYQIGKDHVIENSQGESYISYADYAIAIVDEIEKANHINERFTVVGEK